MERGAAERNGDPYAVCQIKHLSGTDTKEDCAYLYQQDGIMRYVKDPVELVPQRIEVTESRFHIIKYSGQSRYVCHIKVDDRDYKTDWNPWRRELLRLMNTTTKMPGDLLKRACGDGHEIGPGGH